MEKGAIEVWKMTSSPDFLTLSMQKDFTLDLTVQKCASGYLLADLPFDEELSAAIGHIEFSWLKTFCPQLLAAHPPLSYSSVSLYLDGVFSGE